MSRMNAYENVCVCASVHGHVYQCICSFFLKTFEDKLFKMQFEFFGLKTKTIVFLSQIIDFPQIFSNALKKLFSGLQRQIKDLFAATFYTKLSKYHFSIDSLESITH